VVVRKMGVRGYQSSGPYEDLYHAAGLDAAAIAETVEAAIAARGGAAGHPSRACLAVE
jgi:hypothetical protein